MNDLPPHILNWLQETLLNCGPVDDHYDLMRLFVDAKLSPWKRVIPKGRTPQEQTELVIEKLMWATHPQQKLNGLVALLQVFRDRLDPSDMCHQELEALAAILEPLLPPINWDLWDGKRANVDEWRTTRRLSQLLGRKAEREGLLTTYDQMVKTGRGHTVFVLGEIGKGRRALCQWLIQKVEKQGGNTYTVKGNEPNTLKTLSRQIRALGRKGPTLFFVDQLRKEDLAWFDLAAIADEIAHPTSGLPVLLLFTCDCPLPLAQLTQESHTPLTFLAQSLQSSGMADSYFLDDNISLADILEAIGPADPQLAARLQELVNGQDWAMLPLIWQEWVAQKAVSQDKKGVWQVAEMLPNQPTPMGVWQPVRRLPGQLTVYGDVYDQASELLAALLPNAAEAEFVAVPFSLEAAKEILNCAASEGELFTANAVATVLKLNVAELIRFWDDFLVRENGLLSWVGKITVGPGLPPIHQYRFSKPYLYYAWSRFPPQTEKRRVWQKQLGQALEQLYALDPDPVADKLIALFTRSGHPELAERYYWRKENKLPLTILRERVRQLRNSNLNQPSQLAYLLFSLGLELLDRLAAEQPGDWQEGVELAQYLQQLAVRQQYPQYEVSATYYLGRHWQNGGHFAEALPPARQAVALCQQYGVNDLLLAACLNILGTLLKDMGDPAGARPYLERALAIFERVLGPDHPTTATSLNNLGSLLDAMGDPAGARPYLERALAIWERVLGPDHPSTAQSLNNLGTLLYGMGDPAGARPYLERALAILERVLGPDHPDTAASLNNLGMLLKDMGDPAGARPYLDRALAIRERVLGPDHPDTASSLNNLGGLLDAMGDPAGARPYLDRALAIRERVLGPDHPDTASSYWWMATITQGEGKVDLARGYFERALAIFEKVFGPNHPRTRTVRQNLQSLDRSPDIEALLKLLKSSKGNKS